VEPVSDPLLLRKSGSAGNRTRDLGLAARNSDHQTTEAVHRIQQSDIIIITISGAVKPYSLSNETYVTVQPIFENSRRHLTNV
jgi:hypothetical protein